MRKLPETVTTTLSNVRAEADGSLTADCPVCATDGHHSKRLKIYVDAAGAIKGIACVRFASAGIDANRAHCAPVREQLGLTARAEAFIVLTLLDGRLTLECAPAERGKALLVAQNCTNTLHRDLICLDKAEERAKFVKNLNLTTNEQAEVASKMLELAGRFSSSVQAIEEEEETEIQQTIFAALSDGRLIEQITGRQFAIYDGASIKYAAQVEDGEGRYAPVAGDPFVENNDLHLPERLAEYGEEKLLDEEVEAYLSHFCDAPGREMRFAARLVRLTYIQDRLREIPYLHIVGPPGSGKTRMSEVVGMACHRPVMLVNGTAASTFRIADRYMPTICFDEFNLNTDSEDTEAMIQILNAGFQRRRKVPRTEKGQNGEQVTRSYSPYGVKIFSGLKLTGSFAFESRTIPVHLSVTVNKDIPYCDDGLIDELSAPLREKLTLWRLRNWGRDYRSLLRETEALFKKSDVLPRFIQIGVPLAMMIPDSVLRDSFVSAMKIRTQDAQQATEETLDGQLTKVIYDLLAVTEEQNGKDVSRLRNPSECVEHSPCGLLTIGKLLAACDEILPEKVQLQKDKGRRIWLGKQVNGLGLRAAKILTRNHLDREQKAVIFDTEVLGKLFRQFSLPLFADFNVTNVTKPANNCIQRTCPGDIEIEKSVEFISMSPEINDDSKDFADFGDIGDIEIPENCREDFSGVDSSNVTNLVTSPAGEAVPTLVALDTETEPFDEKRGITPRNAKMIGLALSYDGGKKTSYTTEPEAWNILLPEPEQTVVFHNAKFDLGVLRRTGLPEPERWEDTLIAAHLLNETGEHGLKPLAKEHLGVDDPITFEEASQESLLNPDIFDEYAKNDARYTFRLWRKFEPELERQGLRPVYELEKAVVPVVLAMEEAGLKLDLARMGEMAAAVNTELANLKAETFAHAGCKFDLNSPQKVAAILFDKLGIPAHKQTKGGQRSVDREALEDVRGYHPAVDSLLRYREIDKLASTFLNVLPTHADKQCRIHPEFRPLGATSGRFSCSNPNVQQIPSRSELGKKLRQMFVADAGNVLVCADWSQMELRILAQYSKDLLLLSAYQSATETDLHTLTAARMFGKAETDVSKAERSIAKIINFGIVYGITPIGLFNRLKPSGVDVTQAECERFIADYFKTYSGVKKFLKQVEQRTCERGYIKNWFGRRRRVSGLTARQVRQAQNFVIQSTAADLAKTALVRLHAALPEGARLIAMIHDEFIVECHAEQAEDVRRLMLEAMQATPDGFIVTMPVDAKIGGNWAECK